jgi:sugar diacid utilization regulator
MADRWPQSRQGSVLLDHREVQHENARLRQLVNVYQQLTGLTLQDADVSTVARLLADRATATVAVVSRGLEVLAAASPNPGGDVAAYVRDYLGSPRLATVLHSTTQTRRSLRLPDTGDAAGVIVAPILVGDDVPAYLLTFSDGGQDDGGDLSLLVTEHAATICGVILGRERIVAAAARQVRDDLVEGLLLGGGRNNGEVARWARHLGYDPTREHRILAVVVEAAGSLRPAGGPAAQRQRVAAAIDHFFTTRMSGAITSIRDDEVVVVVPEPDADAARLSVACLTRMRDLFPDTVITIGIGGSCRDPADIARSYGQARRTIDAVIRLGRQGQAVAFDDLGIHRLLLQVPDMTELRSFAAEILGKLDGQERHRGSELLSTLACYFRENSSPQRTARSLHVHPNTVAYRIRRIQEITGLQLDTYRDRLMAQVALEIIDALGTGLDAMRYAPGAGAIPGGTQRPPDDIPRTPTTRTRQQA